MPNIKRGVAIVTYNRADRLGEIIEATLRTVPSNTQVIVCDDGSTDNTSSIVHSFGIPYICGKNLGVGANKNRALWGLQDRHFLAIIEDDLYPTQGGWFETYEHAAILSGIQHFCRVQDKQVPESIPAFTSWMEARGLTPIYGPSPRGDFTFITATVLKKCGGFHPGFVGAGYAHGEWSGRVAASGLIGHPNKWVDIVQGNACFVQVGDKEGGRWNLTNEELKKQLRSNKIHLKTLAKTPYLFHPLLLP